MSNREEPEFPTIAIDQDQVKVAREPSAKAQKADNEHKSVQNKKPSSLPKVLLMIMPYVALAVAAWYFYQQQLTVNNTLESSAMRI